MPSVMSSAATPDLPRVGLVLGAGGVLGGSWLIGALHAISAETGWDPATADYIVGTSAGSMIGALLACQVKPELMLAHSRGERPAGSTGDPRYRLDTAGFAFGPGSWRLALASLARPYRYSPGAAISGWLPRGLISTEPLKETIRRAHPGPGWAPHPNYWAMAVDYSTGKRVAFGRAGAPPAELPDAVAASCAIPGFYKPVEIGGRRYIDGGVRSTSNLDVLRDEPVDLIVALNPTSSLHSESGGSLAERLAFQMRQASGRRLGSEAKRLRAAGKEVVLIQPTVPDLDAMGSNLMSSKRRQQVAHTAVQSVTEHLRESGIGERLAALSSQTKAAGAGRTRATPAA
jgi:NTE family protein